MLQLLITPTVRSIANLCIPILSHGHIRSKLRLPVYMSRLSSHRLLLRWRRILLLLLLLLLRGRGLRLLRVLRSRLRNQLLDLILEAFEMIFPAHGSESKIATSIVVMKGKSDFGGQGKFSVYQERGPE